MTAVPELHGLDISRLRDIDLFAPSLKSDPLPAFREWVRYEPFYAIIAGAPAAVVTRYHDVAAAFSDHEKLSSEKPRLAGWERLDYFNGELNIAFSDPPVHTRLRKTLASPLLPSAVRPLTAAIQHIVSSLLDRVEGDTMEVMSQLALPAARNVMLGALLGLPEADFDIFITLTHEMFSLGDQPEGAGHPPSYEAAWASARHYIDAVIDREQAAPTDGVIGQLARAYRDGTLSRGEMVAQMITLYAGGTSPIATLIGSALLMLARHPEQLALLRAEPHRMEATIDEVLRYHSPGLFNFRFAREDFDLNGLFVPAGMPVYMVGHAANFDPDIYDDPFAFDIARERKPLLVFGRGIHFCIGFHVARLVTRTVLEATLERFPQIVLADAEIEYTGNPQERAPVAVRLQVARSISV
ncbi:cytochrome P450 [Novosphingobium sp. CECT 9465]|uniref:cytochrome P450 n=1 Tax=Novosphingobium sp. CECT 9465 TaxID=2829794 RepID=UPI001E57015B|nr:cytochrome P450 [Novosphingobium sp. CECT 9465]CAH0497627.1 Cytochrome P450 107B1 [Novosphingobium sp. CECT 9465]